VIGVVCEAREAAAAREFFELFKTPWEMAEPGVAYDAVIASGAVANLGVFVTGLVIHCSDQLHAGDGELGVVGGERVWPALATIDGTGVPLYRGARELVGGDLVRGRLDDGEMAVVVEGDCDGVRVIRCGYDLFGEVEFLLTQGQPVEHAAIPALDRHIALIRRWLVQAGIDLVELHPAPPGSRMLATLTHDIDFMGIRRHTRDRTLLGFLYRASIGSLRDVFGGRRTVPDLLRNWLALVSLPLVHAGLINDFWLPFRRYVEADAPAHSTFFVVPFRDRPGTGPDGRVEAARGVPYAASEIAGELRDLADRGHEIAVHGIDAWRDPDLGRAELAAITDVAGSDEAGVRMHWLYFDDASFSTLEEAGFSYDATFGYNDTIGFRAGTAQVFAPLGTERLLELPLHVQDTALLYPTRMHLKPADALAACEDLIAQVAEHGGVATISWHERSLSPERLWDRVYAGVRGLLRGRDADVRTAREVVAWFRARRDVGLEGAELDVDALAAAAPAEGDPAALCLRVHHAGGHTDHAVSAADVRAAARRIDRVAS
jgi:peptidoglycan/xylan/chitin deacetylase (PgdA/CDA1 family)